MNDRTDTTTQSSEEQLRELIQALYYVTRHADEIISLKSKILNLNNILNSFEADQSRRTVYNSLVIDTDDSLTQLKAELTHETKEYERQAQLAISSIKCILEKEEKEIINKVTSKSRAVDDFRNFCVLINQQVIKHGKVFHSELETIKNSVTEIRFDAAALLEDIATVFKAEQDRLITGLAEQTNGDISRRVEQIARLMSAFSPQEFFKEHSEKGINQIKKINEEIENQKKKAAEVQNDEVPEHTVKFTKEFITQQLPAIKKRAIAEQEKQSEQQESKYELLKKSVEKSVDMLTQNKHMLDSSRIWIRTEKERNLTDTPNDTGRKQSDMMAHMKDIEVEVADVTKKLDEKATKINQVIQEAVKETEKGDYAAFMPKKRQRPGSDDELDNTQNGIEVRLNEFDTQLQQMEDFLLQFRENVLDPMFPLRFESAIAKVDTVLLNHGAFISYLFNPTKASKVIQAEETKSLPTSVLNDIINIIKKEQEESTSQLHKRIKVLEDKLSAE